MKLNLLPVGVSRGSSMRNGIIAGVVLAGLGIFVASSMIGRANKDIQSAQEEATQAKPAADQAVAIAASADTIISKAQGVILNINLADAMNAHNTVYPDFYNDV